LAITRLFYPTRARRWTEIELPYWRSMLYMIVEHFKHRDPLPVYRRFRDQGRLAPAGLSYISSWVDEKLERCYQLMETGDRAFTRPVGFQLERSDRVRDSPGDSVQGSRREDYTPPLARKVLPAGAGAGAVRACFCTG